MAVTKSVGTFVTYNGQLMPGFGRVFRFGQAGLWPRWRDSRAHLALNIQVQYVEPGDHGPGFAVAYIWMPTIPPVVAVCCTAERWLAVPVPRLCATSGDSKRLMGHAGCTASRLTRPGRSGASGGSPVEMRAQPSHGNPGQTPSRGNSE